MTILWMQMLNLKEKLKIVLTFVDHIFVRVGGWVGTLETLSKALLLSKSLEYIKLDSLAYNNGKGSLHI